MREKGKRKQITVPTPNCLVYHFPFAESLFQSIRGNLPTTACLSPRRESRKSSKLVRKSHSCGDKRQSSGQRQAGSCVSSFALGGASLCEAGWDRGGDQRESKTLSLPLSSHPAAPAAKGRTCSIQVNQRTAVLQLCSTSSQTTGTRLNLHCH